jgi:hypothetical protein
MKRKPEFPLPIPPWQGNYESEIGAIYYQVLDYYYRVLNIPDFYSFFFIENMVVQ